MCIRNIIGPGLSNEMNAIFLDEIQKSWNDPYEKTQKYACNFKDIRIGSVALLWHNTFKFRTFKCEIY